MVKTWEDYRQIKDLTIGTALRGTWDVATWPDDKWFKKENLEPEYILESARKGDLRKVKVLDKEVRRNIDLEFLEKASAGWRTRRPGTSPSFIYFNHSNVHFPVLPRAEYEGSSNGGVVADCLQMLDGDFKVLLDKLDELGLRDNTIVIFAGDNGRDNVFHAPGNRSAPGPWRGGYFSTFEGNNHTACTHPLAAKDRTPKVRRDDAHHRLVPDLA